MTAATLPPLSTLSAEQIVEEFAADVRAGRATDHLRFVAGLRRASTDLGVSREFLGDLIRAQGQVCHCGYPTADHAEFEIDGRHVIDVHDEPATS